MVYITFPNNKKREDIQLPTFEEAQEAIFRKYNRRTCVLLSENRQLMAFYAPRCGWETVH